MEKKTIYKYKNDESYKSNEEYRVVTFINGNQDIMKITLWFPEKAFSISLMKYQPKTSHIFGNSDKLFQGSYVSLAGGDDLFFFLS